MKPLPPPKPNHSRLIIGILLAVVLLGGIVSFLKSAGKGYHSVARKAETISIILPPPPLPPPPPTPPPPQNEPPPDKQEMVEQVPVEKIEPPEAPPAAPPDESLGTNNAGNGPDMGLTKGGGNGTGRNNNIGGGRHGGKWDAFAVGVQTTISDALRRNSGTRSASFSMTVKVWADENGRITRAQLVGSSGNPAVDQAIKSQVLTGLQLSDPPPAGMPMPINMRISARQSI